MLKWTPIVFLASGLASYVACALLGLAAAPKAGEPLSDEKARAALDFAFPDRAGQWASASGSASHGWLYRRAHVEGVLAEGTSSEDATAAGTETRCAEQILKVGWPFTSVRGFVRFDGESPDHAGVGWTDATGPGDPARLLPLLPIWPGLALHALVSTGVFVGVGTASALNSRSVHASTPMCTNR